MNFQCQTEAMANLKILAEHKQHGVLIVGPAGCGKTYLAKAYANLLKIPDFYIVNPVMGDLKVMLDSCVSSTNPQVLCIENLDSGVLQASYPLLKLIEDCPSHIYIVVTCCNLYAIPDTIPSRCALVTVNQPTAADIAQYAQSVDATNYDLVSKQKIWGCVKGFADADTVLKFTPEHLRYFDNLRTLLSFKDSISNIAWKLSHFEDKTDTPIILVFRYIMLIIPTEYGKKTCVDCLNDLAANNLSKNAVISKFVLENKYCG